MAITDYSILPVHDSKSQPPQLFDGTTRLYISVKCPYAQRVWITRNCKGLQDIQILPIDLQDRPDWYKEKVYPPNKVPSLEHNGKVTGESLDLLRYLNNNFEGPELNPTDPAKKEAADELLKHSDSFPKVGFAALSKPESEVGQEVDRYQIVFPRLKNYDITAGRPKLSKWIEEVNKIDAYTKTKIEPDQIVEFYKRLLANHQK